MPAASGYEYHAGNWRVLSGTTQKPPVKLEVDDDVFRTKAPSLRFSSNEELLDKAHAILQVQSEYELDTTKKYRVSGYVKKNKAGYVFDRVLGSANDARMYDVCGTWQQYVTTDWVKFEHDYVPAAKDYYVINFTMAAGVEDLWIDDVSLYELDADGNPTGNDLMAGRGTIDDVAPAPDAPTGVTVENKIGEAMITWDETDAAYVAVYNEAVSADIPVAYVPASLCYVDIKNLAAGATYDFTVKAINAEGRESAEGASVTAEPLAEDLIIGEYQTSVSGETVTVSIDIKNNNAGEDFTAQLLLGVYNGETLEGFTGTTVTAVPQTAINAEPVTLSKAITVPNGYSLVMYLWNSIDGMRPIIPSVAY